MATSAHTNCLASIIYNFLKNYPFSYLQTETTIHLLSLNLWVKGNPKPIQQQCQTHLLREPKIHTNIEN